jgi:hypothetical protein
MYCIMRFLAQPEFQKSRHVAEAIPVIVNALAATFQDVEEFYSVWRHERVRAALESGAVLARFSKDTDIDPTNRVHICQEPHHRRLLAARSWKASGYLPRILSGLLLHGVHKGSDQQPAWGVAT